MNIYAIKDRMIDYFVQPFAAPGDKEVLAAIAGRVNNTEDTDAITQAPHHFEIWRVGTFSQETGHIDPTKEFLADCSSLVRTSVRETARPTDAGTDQAPSSRPGAPGVAAGPTEATTGPLRPPTQREAVQGAPEGPATGRSPPGRINPRARDTHEIHNDT